MTGSAPDVERRQLEAALREREEYARLLLEQAPELEVVVLEKQAAFWSNPLSNKWLVDLADGRLLTHDLGAAARATAEPGLAQVGRQRRGEERPNLGQEIRLGRARISARGARRLQGAHGHRRQASRACGEGPR